jgi:predicted RNase H-like HicB family nuclease
MTYRGLIEKGQRAMSELRYPVTILYSEEDGGYIAIAPDLKGCSAFGETPQEALNELEVAMDLWLEVARKDAAPIPEPTRMTA